MYHNGPKVNLLMSIFVFTQNPRSVNNQFFSLLSFLAAVWAFANYMTGIYSTPFWLESTYSLGGMLVAIGFLWTTIITENKLGRMKAGITMLVAFSFFFLSYMPGFIAKEYGQIYIGGVFTGTPGLGLWVYTIFYLLGAVMILYKLYVTQKTVDDQKKLQLSYVFYGALFTLVITAFTSFIFPSLSIFSFSGLDSVGFLIFLSLIGLSITKGHLFNIKVITTELITFGLWIFILVRVILADTTQDMLIEGSLLAVTIIFGILLIKSVIKEVSLRENIEKLATDLQKANSRLTELDRQKSEFVSFATHQLRAPLTAMKGYASLILEGDMGAITDATRDAIVRIFDSTKTLASIVDDYLNISRIELGSMKYAFDTIDLKSMVQDVIAELKPNIDAKKDITFSFEPDTTITNYRTTADRDKLKQVIANLVDNSIKYTPKGWVKVSLGMDRVKHLLVFKVEDNGIGISPEVLPLLFQKFSRAPGANKVNIKGTGLGLFVAKEIIAAHHGTIHAESPGEGKGSSFIVELEPFAKV